MFNSKKVVLSVLCAGLFVCGSARASQWLKNQVEKGLDKFAPVSEAVSRKVADDCAPESGRGDGLGIRVPVSFMQQVREECEAEIESLKEEVEEYQKQLEAAESEDQISRIKEKLRSAKEDLDDHEQDLAELEEELGQE